MSSHDWSDDLIPRLLYSFMAFCVIVLGTFSLVVGVRALNNRGAAPDLAWKPEPGPAGERRPGGAEAVPVPAPGATPRPGAPAGAPARKAGLRDTPPEGGFIAQTRYREERTDGAVLIGFEADFGKVFHTDVVTYLRPIWLTPRGEQFGTAYGRAQGPVTTVKAQSGYAVGGIVVAGGGALEGFCLTFMRIGTRGLIANDAYTSDWYGEADRRPRAGAMRSGDGAFVVGLHGKRFEDAGGKNFDDGGAIGTIGLVLWANE